MDNENSSIPAAPRDWQARYTEGNTPWDSGHVSSRLKEVIQRHHLTPQDIGPMALEIGCGTGNNATFLSRQGFQVTAIDIAEEAILRAKQIAAEDDLNITFLVADLAKADFATAPFDLVFDRGCYHCMRQENPGIYPGKIADLTRPGARILILAGNANEPMTPGPPTVTEADLREDFQQLFTIDELEAFRFDETPQAPTRPLGWSCLLTRR